MAVKAKNKLRPVHTLLFQEDVDTLKQLADDKGTKWQVELRQLVRRALRGEKKDIYVLREK